MSLTSSPSARPEQVGMRTLTDTVWELQQVPLLQCKWKTGDVQAKGSLWGSTLEIQAHQGWSSMCFAVPIGFIPTKDPRCLAAPWPLAPKVAQFPRAWGTLWFCTGESLIFSDFAKDSLGWLFAQSLALELAWIPCPATLISEARARLSENI